jgi:TPR repeat protein
MKFFYKFVTFSVLIIISIFGIYKIYNYVQMENKFKPTLQLFKETDSIDIKNLMFLVENNHFKSNHLLGEYFIRDNDTSKALFYFQKSYDLGENLHSSWKVSICQGADLEKIWWLANSGKIIDDLGKSDWHFQYDLADALLTNKDKVYGKIDSNLIFKLFLESAKADYVKAYYKIALCYQNGIGTTKNVSEAINWLEKGAYCGDSYCQAQLGENYIMGLGIKKSNYLGLKYTNMAAKKDNSIAMLNLAKWYLNGTSGIEKNEKEGLKWVDLLSKRGNNEAAKIISDYNKKRVANYRAAQEYTNGLESLLNALNGYSSSGRNYESNNSSVCYRCNGSGYVNCYKCNGTLQIECNTCRNGYLRNSSGEYVCFKCNGRQRISCYKCSNGREDCSKCHGYGKR